tara:strand:+ start:1590 stop:2036 length:447 start_codon:yes stop_codon:yes gene_type:complete
MNGKGSKPRPTNYKQYSNNYDVIFSKGDKKKMNWKDLAPDIFRQRIIIEGTLHKPFLAEDMTRYCNEITEVLKMTAVTAPVCNYDPDYGWCAYTHWKESGMHIYGWDDRKPPFFSIDIYTCKAFDPQHAINYSKEFFGENLIDLAWRE